MKDPKTRTGRWLSGSLTVLLLAYLLLLLFPEVAFGHKVIYRSFVVYAHEPLPENLPELLDQADLLLQQSEFYKEQPAEHKLFFCDTFLEYAFFAPGSFRAFAINNSITRKIIFARADVAANRALANASENNQRSLSGTIAHEVTHSLLKQAFGPVKEAILETWKKEGYCDLIARESSFGTENGLKMLCQTQQRHSPSFQYFKYRLCVAYLMQHKQQTFKALAAAEYDREELEKAVRQKYCGEMEPLKSTPKAGP